MGDEEEEEEWGDTGRGVVGEDFSVVGSQTPSYESQSLYGGVREHRQLRRGWRSRSSMRAVAPFFFFFTAPAPVYISGFYLNAMIDHNLLLALSVQQDSLRSMGKKGVEKKREEGGCGNRMTRYTREP